jgi:general secretion pathway protein G
MRVIRPMFVPIVVVFAMIVVPKFASSGDNRHSGSDKARSEISTFKGLLDRFKLDCGRYPTTQEGLAALHDGPLSLKGKWAGPYTDKAVFDDPWGHTYLYRADGGDDYTLVSYGEDGKEGGEGYNADLDDRDE